jgi:cytochrome P450
LVNTQIKIQWNYRRMAFRPGQNIPIPETRYRDRYAIVGVGETDYREDYQAAREAAKSGVHLCLGQILAKMEMRILWNDLIPQLKSVRLAGETKLTESYFVNGLKHLPIEFEMV